MKKFLWLKIWWTSVKRRCHSNQFCGVKRRQVGIKRLHCLWAFLQRLVKPMPTLRLWMYVPSASTLHLVKISWTLMQFIIEMWCPVCNFWLTPSRGVLSTYWRFPSTPCVVFLACVHLALFFALSPGNSLVSSWCGHEETREGILASLLWQCLTVPSLRQLC